MPGWMVLVWRNGIAAQIEKTTGQKLGADADAWKKWIEKNKPAPGKKQ
jgi:hypothetical protein